MAFDDLSGHVRMVLMRDWDPIGVKNEPAAHDEYDEYAGKIVKMLKASTSVEDLYKYLREVETITIGLPGDRDRTRRVAERLSALKK